jgi:hypothetical protein
VSRREVDGPGDEFGQGGLRIFAGEALEQAGVGHEVVAEGRSPPGAKIRQGKCEGKSDANAAALAKKGCPEAPTGSEPL